ncbi:MULTISPECIES: MotE family protein [unclassified Azospirillum]|uniref:MotE family protein n=1 Tax=unclassified Azospirillum TaxID=2630922 RepID=UPI000B674D00|nr:MULTISPECIES: hypothetical protein [unclassified Azospirillum]SNS39162.1 Flagellar motility protein MotE, a chaperone for MotC folding [Azospirillum sp. RU38E]SNS57548.1 Flagellar motility protein MotE, a chaperone for MotC folding [Azospirillum sp. RU37A]
MSVPPDMPAAPAVKSPAPPRAAAPRAPGKVPAGKRPVAAKPKVKARRRPLLRPGLLPATILAAGLLIGVKVGDIWMAVTTGAAFNPVPPSVAEEQAPQGLPEKPDTAKLAVPPATQVAAANAPAQEPAAPKPEPAQAPSPPVTPAPAVQHGDDHGAAPSGAPGQSFTPKEVEILQRLQERREQLDQRGRELDQREAMLVAAESRFDQKIAELQKLKQEIQGLLTTVNAEQQTQLDSLVKIYETMKPVDAAKIFNSLENKVLLNVISRMKEAKAAPVLAAMDSARAQEVTILLAERKRLPTVPE